MKEDQNVKVGLEGSRGPCRLGLSHMPGFELYITGDGFEFACPGKSPVIFSMQLCPACSRSQPEINRFCIQCGRRLDGRSDSPPPSPRHAVSGSDQLNLTVLYGMVVLLILALLFPPWETPPTQTPEFLGMYFILSPPAPEAVVSRMLLTIELVTIAIAGLYAAFLFRKK